MLQCCQCSSHASQGNVNVRVLSRILKKNAVIQSLDLNGAGLTDIGVAEVSPTFVLCIF